MAREERGEERARLASCPGSPRGLRGADRPRTGATLFVSHLTLRDVQLKARGAKRDCTFVQFRSAVHIIMVLQSVRSGHREARD